MTRRSSEDFLMDRDPRGVTSQPSTGPGEDARSHPVRPTDTGLGAPDPATRVAHAAVLAPYEHAVSACGRAFLSERSDESIQLGLNALLDATDADIVAVIRNVDDHDVGPAGRMEHSTTRLGVPWDGQGGAPVPWTGSRRAADHLSQGAPIALNVAALSGPERALYEAARTGTVLEVPIVVDGHWLGHLALVDFADDREWAGPDVTLSDTIARFVGAMWEREHQRERLQRTIQSRDRFISSVNHRLRTPLTALVGATTLLSEEDSLTPDERAEFVDSIAKQSLEVADVIEDLFIAARADIGAVKLDIEPVDLRVAAENARASFPPAARAAITFDPGTVTASGDPRRVGQILRNLLDNAIRHGGPSIGVAFDETDGRVRARVWDDGAGMPGEGTHLAEQLEDYRVSPDQLGLGLLIAWRLARLMGGDLHYERDAGLTTFSLELPRAV